MTNINYKNLCREVMTIARQAGAEILRIYNHVEGFDVNAKGDNSPVTAADIAAHHVLKPGLEALLPGVPVLSEESTLPDYNIRKNWSRYWIIDPLDGTKEFIKRNGEFTVNIALIENGVAVLGIVFVPVLDLMYTGIKGMGAQKISNGKTEIIKTRLLQPRIESKQAIEVVASRSHGAEDVDRFLSRVADKLGNVALKNMGSSLKLCLVAEGSADIYPRLALTSEWDTAAAQAVVEAAGGKVVDIHLNVMRYNTKDDILNPYFFVLGDPDYPWEAVLKH
jgi:3'(2'), 5'-bisphosphate nucleotidase